MSKVWWALAIFAYIALTILVIHSAHCTSANPC